MTRIIITMLSIIMSLLTNAQETTGALEKTEKGISINVTVPKVSSNNGLVYFALFNSKESFTQRDAYQLAQGEILDGKTEIQFSNIPKGLYAITCYHDVNSNQSLDFDGYMPIEDYGSSNNPQAFGPPQFEASKFEVLEDDLTLTINF